MFDQPENPQPAPQAQPPVQQQFQQPQYQQPAPEPTPQPQYQQPQEDYRYQDPNQPPLQPLNPQPQQQQQEPAQPQQPNAMPEYSDYAQAQAPQQPEQYQQPAEAPVEAAPFQQPAQAPQQNQVFAPAPEAQGQKVVEDASVMDSKFEAWLDESYPMPELPKIDDINGDDPAALSNFFAAYDEAQRARIRTESTREALKAEKDNYLWTEVERKYPDLRHAPTVRSTLERMYQGARSLGQNVTPLMVTDEFVGQMNQNYQQGYQSNRQQVTIRQSQPAPNGGQRQAPPQPVVTQQHMENLNQNSNDVIDDAAAIVARMRAAGQGGFKN